MVLPQEVQQEMLSRLRRIEGQARGVQRMVEEGRDCAEIIQQLAAIRAATHSASLFLLKHYAKECSSAAAQNNEGSAKPIEDLVDLMLTIS
ncbi:MAG: metal-sensitive transcriptional regulator [Chloroflexi bacterium]|nr:metal-sensitive transcriptional regulator [Chloroflexota bacterium]